MRKVNVKEVNTEREMDDFVGLTERLYAGSPYYVPDMETDIRETFDPRKNAGLDFSDIQPFIAYASTEMRWAYRRHYQPSCE